MLNMSANDLALEIAFKKYRWWETYYSSFRWVRKMSRCEWLFYENKTWINITHLKNAFYEASFAQGVLFSARYFEYVENCVKNGDIYEDWRLKKVGSD